jgi:antitoxin component of RelBE/YafQ-DinJ toxin-antitoxin module
MEPKDDRVNLRINRQLKKLVQQYCDTRGLDLSTLVTLFFQRIVSNEAKRKTSKK